MTLHTFTQFLISLIKNPNIWYNSWYKGDIHFIFSFVEWLPNLRIQFHDDFCADKDLDLVLLRNEVTPEEFVYEALKITQGCRFIIFEASSEEFIQFWVQHNQCLLSYPLMKGNNHKQHLDMFLSILSEMGFEQETLHQGYNPPPNQCAIRKSKKMTDYLVNFGEISPRVAEFTNRMFVEGFDDDLVNVSAKVG